MTVGRSILLLCLVLGAQEAESQQGLEQSPCAEALDTSCGQTYRSDSQSAGTDVSRICQAVDVMLGCTASVVQSCGSVETAQLVQRVKTELIEGFGPDSDTGCRLVNASLAVYRDRPCSSGLALCFGLLSDAEMPAINADPFDPTTAPDVDPLRACMYHEGFTQCIEEELGSCSAEVMAEVQQKVTDAQATFIDTYKCRERQGELKFQDCFSPLLQSAGQVDRDRLCQVYEETRVCVDEAKALSSGPEQAELIDRQFAEFSAFANKSPYFCYTDNPCLEEIVACTQAITPSPLEEPCLLMQVYDTCLSESLQQCEHEHRAEALEYLNKEKKQIDDLNSCSSSVRPVVLPTDQQTACDEVAINCSQAMTQGLAVQAVEDINNTCQLVDSLLECVIDGSVVCDPLLRADMMSAIKPVIAAYTDPQSFGCDLKNADDPALLTDACDVASVRCSTLLYQAEAHELLDPLAVQSACRDYDAYKKCTSEELGECGDVRLQIVNEHVINATNKFHGNPYFCEADNPCLQRFKTCRERLINEGAVQEPCDEMDVIETCLQYVVPTCSSDHLIITMDIATLDKDRIRLDNSCQPVVSPVPFTGTMAPEPPIAIPVFEDNGNDADGSPPSAPPPQTALTSPTGTAPATGPNQTTDTPASVVPSRGARNDSVDSGSQGPRLHLSFWITITFLWTLALSA